MPPVAFIVEQRMANVFHVRTNLVRTACLQLAFQQGDIPQAFHHAVMRHSRLAAAAVRKDRHLLPVSGIASNVPFYRSVIFIEAPPGHCRVQALRCFVEKLPAQVRLGGWIFGNNQQTGRILVNPMNQDRDGDLRLEKPIGCENTRPTH